MVIEIGPGKGALTESLLAYSDRVVAIEIDSYLVHYLRQKFHDSVESGRLELIEGDILKTDLAAISAKPIIAGNLPYYITSPILEKIFSLNGGWECAVFMVQAEVGARLTAQPGSRDFGYLSVLAQVQAKVERLFDVPRDAFRPPPKVDSTVVRLEPANQAIRDLPGFLRFAQLCFRQKRKTLRNNLAPIYGMERVDGLPEARLRAEQLRVPQLISLYDQLSIQSPG